MEIVDLKQNDTHKSIYDQINQESKRSTFYNSSNVLKKCLELLKKQNFKSLKKTSSKLIFEDLPFLRSILWRIYLNYLSLKTLNWEQFLDKKRTEYYETKNAYRIKMDIELDIFLKMLSKHKKFHNTRNIDCTSINSDLQDEDLHRYILCTDKMLLESIDTDVRRTHTNMHFFSQPVNYEECKGLSEDDIYKIQSKSRVIEVKNLIDLYDGRINSTFETRADVISRILYIFAKENPEYGYIQGMNELISPIYYCLSTSTIYCTEEIEADTFWCFSSLMKKLEPIFRSSSDKKLRGIFDYLKLVKQAITLFDKEIDLLFKNEGVELELFAFRWVMLIFSQEFQMPDILRLWDVILSHDNIHLMVILACLSVLEIKKKDIMNLEFSGIITSLQHIEDISVEDLVSNIKKNKKVFGRKIKNLIKSCKYV